MDEQEIIDNIGGPISEERTLRDRSTRNMGLRADEKSCLRTVEVQLDQCWDLLRQRRALSESVTTRTRRGSVPPTKQRATRADRTSS